MAKARNFNELLAKMSPGRRATIEARARKALDGMSLDELRGACEITQEDVASRLEITQSSVSKMERGTDMCVSTLARFIEAVGGRLEIRAVFPDGGAVRITQFSRES